MKRGQAPIFTIWCVGGSPFAAPPSFSVGLCHCNKRCADSVRGRDFCDITNRRRTKPEEIQPFSKGSPFVSGAAMPRGRRLIFRNAIYHLMARGNRKLPIFEDARDRQHFVDILDEASARYRVVVHAECRMGNHYHAVVGTPDANVSAFMGYLNGQYAQYSNRRHGRTGHLFGDRYKPVLVDTGLYLRVVISYVENNPVAAGLVKSPTDYAWSSCRATVGLEPAPSYLSLDWLDLAFPAASRQESQRKYCEYLAASTLEEAEGLLEQPAIGPKPFAKDVREHIGRLLYLARVPRSYRALHRPSLEELFPRGLNKRERASAMLRAHIVHGYRLSEIARCLAIHPNTVSRTVSILRRRVVMGDCS